MHRMNPGLCGLDVRFRLEDSQSACVRISSSLDAGGTIVM